MDLAFFKAVATFYTGEVQPNGKEKTIKYEYLVYAASPTDVEKQLAEYLKRSTMDHEVTSISKTKIESVLNCPQPLIISGREDIIGEVSQNLNE